MGKDFVFAGHKFSYPDGAENSTALFGDWMKKAFEAKLEFENFYDDKVDDIQGFFQELNGFAEEFIQKEQESIIGYLFSKGINMTEVEFTEKYSEKYEFVYENLIPNLSHKCDEIYAHSQALAAERENNKVFEGTWSGGGFGLRGAIKGAFKAGILNFAQETINSAVASAQEKNDNEQIFARIVDLYNAPETKYEVGIGAYKLYMNLYYALNDELIENKILAYDLKLSEENAEKLFNNTMRFSSGDDVAKNICKCIEHFPDKKYLERIYSFVSDTDYTDFQDFISFWHLEFYGLDKETLAKKAEEMRLAQEQAEKERQERLRQEELERAELEAQRRIEREKKERQEKLFSYVNQLYESKVVSESDKEFFCTIRDVLLCGEKSQKEIQTAVKSYASNIDDEGEELVLFAYNCDPFVSFSSGFLLTDKRLYVKWVGEEPCFWKLSDVKEITLTPKLLSCALKVNGCLVDDGIPKKKHTKQGESLVELLKGIISYCLSM